MTKEQIKTEMKRRLPEYFDAYLLVGVVAEPDPGRRGAQVVMICQTTESARQSRVLRAGAINVLSSHGILNDQ